MKFYRLDMRSVADGSHGCEFFTNRRDADKARREWFGNFEYEETICDREGSEIEVIEIEPTKQGILRALQRWATHADNG